MSAHSNAQEIVETIDLWVADRNQLVEGPIPFALTNSFIFSDGHSKAYEISCGCQDSCANVAT